MTRRRKLLALALITGTVAACDSWFTDTQCKSIDDCGGTLFCDLSQSPGRCVERLPAGDSGTVAPDAGDLDAQVPVDATFVIGFDGGPADIGGAADVGTPDASPAGQPPVAHCASRTSTDAGEWCTYTLGSSGTTLRSVWGNSATNIWVVGDSVGNAPTIWHWNGLQWEDKSAGPFTWAGDAGVPSVNVVSGFRNTGSPVLGGPNEMVAWWTPSENAFHVNRSAASSKTLTTAWSAQDGDQVWLGGAAGALLMIEPTGGPVRYCSLSTAIESIAGSGRSDLFVLDAAALSYITHVTYSGCGASTYQSIDADRIWVDGQTLYRHSDQTFKCTVTGGIVDPLACSAWNNDFFKAIALYGVGTGSAIELWAIAGGTGKVYVARNARWNMFGDTPNGLQAIWALAADQVVAVGNNGQVFVHWR